METIKEKIYASFDDIGKEGYAVQTFKFKEHPHNFYSVKKCRIIGFQFGIKSYWNKYIVTNGIETFAINKRDFVENKDDAYDLLASYGKENKEFGKYITIKKSYEYYQFSYYDFLYKVSNKPYLIIGNKDEHDWGLSKCQLGKVNRVEWAHIHDEFKSEQDAIDYFVEYVKNKGYEGYYTWDNFNRKAIEVSFDEFINKAHSFIEKREGRKEEREYYADIWNPQDKQVNDSSDDSEDEDEKIPY